MYVQKIICIITAENIEKRIIRSLYAYLVQLVPTIFSSRLRDEHSSDSMSLLEYEGMIFLTEKA
jgi:hypothetical protein